MSKATLVFLKEKPVKSDSQGSQSNPRCHNIMEAVAAEQTPTDPIARHLSMQTPSTDPDVGCHKYCDSPAEDRRGETAGSPSDVAVPSWRVSTKPNVKSSIRGQALDGSAGAPRFGIHTHSHSPAPDYPVRDRRDEGGTGMSTFDSSKEHDSGITGNKVTVPRTPQHFRVPK